jgi:iron(III) transport system permease protein
MTLTSYFDAMEWIGEPLQNTLIVMVGAIVIAATLASSITWVVTRSQHQSARWVDAVVFLAPAVPTIVTATAFQYAGVMVYQWLPLYGTIWLIAIAMGTRMLAYCTRTMNSAALQIQFELDEASYVAGVSKLTTFRRIFLPLMAPAIFYSALMVGMLAARDLTLPLVMNTGKQQVVSVLIFDLQTNGDQNAAAAVSLYMIIVLVLLALFARRMTGMQELGIHRQRRRRQKSTLSWFNGWRTAPSLGRKKFARRDAKTI